MGTELLHSLARYLSSKFSWYAKNIFLNVAFDAQRISSSFPSLNTEFPQVDFSMLRSWDKQNDPLHI